jgi:pyrimidine operon attenuation protein / uracil phosphoribosyltransferase
VTETDKIVLDAGAMRRALLRIAHEVLEKTHGRQICVIGIHRRGAVLANRLRDQIVSLLGMDVPLGDLDISFYRDDVGLGDRPIQPVVHGSHIDFVIDGMTVVLVDDVLYTGRTVRAAIEAIFDYGRPRALQLAVMADRGHRELPIRPDYVGKNLPTSDSERVNVRLRELDGADEVAISDTARAQRDARPTGGR